MKIRRDRKKREKGAEGSAWTSYSDLFMAIAVVFLILFVFAMLNSGVTQLNVAVERKEQEKFLKGLVPEEVLKQNKEEMDSLKEDIEEVEEKEAGIKKNIKDLKN